MMEKKPFRVSDAQWPPKMSQNTQNTPLFYRVSNEHGVKKIAWPPKTPNRSFELNGYNDEDVINDQMVSSQHPDHNEEDRYALLRATGRTPPPGVVMHPLRESPPVKQSPVPTVPSQPFLRSCTPTRKLGDRVWPPKNSIHQNDPELQNPNSAKLQLKPKKSAPKDYRPLFSRHRIPSSCPVTYWIPPGTQHIDSQ